MGITSTGEKMALIERVVEDHVARTGRFPSTPEITKAVDGAAGGRDAIRELLDLLVKNGRLAVAHEAPGNPTIYVPRSMYDAILRSQRPPDWMAGYAFDEVGKIKKKIRKQEEQLMGYHLVERLLYGTGRGLEEAVAKALEILEFEDLEAPYEDHDSWDISFTYEGDTYVLDVKGKGKYADKEDATQLQGWLQTYVERHSHVKADRVKGALIINHFRHVDPQERWPADPDHSPVSEMCERYLQLNGQTFLTAPELFEVTRRVVRGEITPKVGRKEVMSSFRGNL